MLNVEIILDALDIFKRFCLAMDVLILQLCFFKTIFWVVECLRYFHIIPPKMSNRTEMVF